MNTYRLTARHTCRQTDRQTSKHTGSQAARQKYGPETRKPRPDPREIQTGRERHADRAKGRHTGIQASENEGIETGNQAGRHTYIHTRGIGSSLCLAAPPLFSSVRTWYCRLCEAQAVVPALVQCMAG